MKFKASGRSVFQAVFAVICCTLSMVVHGAQAVVLHPKEGEKPMTNPLRGDVAWGSNYSADAGVTLAYIPVHWSMVEPQEGVYDFDALEKAYHMNDWRAEGVRFVFRILLDEPGDERHMDIPQWLYDQTDGAGTWYKSSYGKGFSPDYTNAVLQKAHTKLIEAFASHYADDPHTAFIQLGSLGHWGEWHVHPKAGIAPFPDQSVSDLYVQDYLRVFPASKLLLRRPYAIGRDERLGLYNDSFADPQSHEQWLHWIAEGYVSDQNLEALSGMPSFWEAAPSGGELASSHKDGWYFSDKQFGTTMQLTAQSHATFIGPHGPDLKRLDKTERANAERFLAELGYCFRISKVKLKNAWKKATMEAEITIQNIGMAPMYEQWPLRLMLLRDGETVWQADYDVPFTSYLPGTYKYVCELQGTQDLARGKYTLAAGIVDPITGEPGVALAMRKHEGNIYELGDVMLWH